MGRLSGNQIRRIVLILFLVAIGYQLVLSAGAMAWLARGAGRGTRLFAIVVGTSRIHDVMPKAAAAGLRDGDQLLKIDGRPFTGRVVWSSEFRGKHAGEPMTFTVQAPGTASPLSVSIPLDSTGGLGPFGWPV